jgi:hypothetical protein
MIRSGEESTPKLDARAIERVQRIVLGQTADEAVSAELYLCHSERLFRFCIRRVDDKAKNEGAVPMNADQSWEDLPRFAGDECIYPWLPLIASKLRDHRLSANLPSASERSPTPKSAGAPNSGASRRSAPSMSSANHRDRVPEIGWAPLNSPKWHRLESDEPVVVITWRNRDGGGIVTFEHVDGTVSSRPMSRESAHERADQAFGAHQRCESFDGGYRWSTTLNGFAPNGRPYR